MSHPNTALGLSCPSEGKFYVCDTAKIRFIGCCMIDPCVDGSGVCPQKNIRPSSFSSEHYDEIKPQSCVNADPETSWFTCKSSTPFLGCCKSNPCDQGKCPTKDLLAGRLSDDPTAAQVLIGTASSAPTTSATSTAPTTSSVTGPQLSTGSIVGISVAVAVSLLILLSVLAYRCGWLARRRRAQQEAEKGQILAATSPFAYSSASLDFPSQYQDSKQPGSNGFFPYSSAPSGYRPTSSYNSHGTSAGLPLPMGSNPPVPISDSWDNDPRHGSQMTMATWDSMSPSIAQNQNPTWELDGVELQRPRVIAELPESTVKRE